jgi:hypothetical protein
MQPDEVTDTMEFYDLATQIAGPGITMGREGRDVLLSRRAAYERVKQCCGQIWDIR